jgi:hypothetical protein
MNKLIERFIAESTICEGNPQIDGSYFDKEKFAELIVRECADIADMNTHQWDLPGKYIIQHFGVKE